MNLWIEADYIGRVKTPNSRCAPLVSMPKPSSACFEHRVVAVERSDLTHIDAH